MQFHRAEVWRGDRRLAINLAYQEWNRMNIGFDRFTPPQRLCQNTGIALRFQLLRRARKFMMKAIRGWQGGGTGLGTSLMGLKSGEMAGRCMMAKNERILVRNTKICS